MYLSKIVPIFHRSRRTRSTDTFRTLFYRYANFIDDPEKNTTHHPPNGLSNRQIRKLTSRARRR